MDGEMHYDPPVVHQGASYLSDAGEALAEIQRRLYADIEYLSNSKPWGNDEIGQAFEENYKKIFPQLMHGWPNLTTDVSEYGTAVSYVEEAAEQANAAARQRLTW